jgi:hypothetical protein
VDAEGVDEDVSGANGADCHDGALDEGEPDAGVGDHAGEAAGAAGADIDGADELGVLNDEGVLDAAGDELAEDDVLADSLRGLSAPDRLKYQFVCSCDGVIAPGWSRVSTANISQPRSPRSPET